ncbi:TPR end-of-group domain-containing protein, partial [Massilia sp.]|uniref:TPR end-of-group domain-containing protein n=1 Tax=Massilia sp. TaxID=1882437 RepID=UPI003918312D
VAAAAAPPPVAKAAPSLPAADAPASWSAAYEAARAAARDGDDDAAVRQLYQAYSDGWRDGAHAVAAPEFARLRDDVRFQVLLVRLKGT